MRLLKGRLITAAVAGTLATALFVPSGLQLAFAVMRVPLAVSTGLVYLGLGTFPADVATAAAGGGSDGSERELGRAAPEPAIPSRRTRDDPSTLSVVTASGLAGRVCLVTGATGGIGRATAVALARHDARLLLSGRDEASLAAVAAETGGSPIRADLSRRGAARRLAMRALKTSGRIDVVVHAAGEGRYGPAAALDPTDLERLVAVNVTSVIELSCAVLPGMLERRAGHIVTIGSVAGRLGHRYEAAYSATKAAVSVFSDSLAEELAGSGVSASLITPGVVDTPFFDRRGAPYDRTWPRPVPPEIVAERVVAVLRVPRREIVVPGFLSAALRLRGALPGVYRALATRFG